MKKLILLAVLLLPVLTFASIDTNLRYGSKGDEVTQLQEFLIDKGFLTGTASGNFYSLTRKAVIAYQTSVSLPSTGFVGQMTRGIINADLAKGTSSEEASSTAVVTPSTDTAVLQAKLDDLMKQMATLQAQQTTQTAQSNQILSTIAQNTTPVVSAVPMGAPALIAPVVAPAPQPVTATASVVEILNPSEYTDGNKLITSDSRATTTGMYSSVSYISKFAPHGFVVVKLSVIGSHGQVLTTDSSPERILTLDINPQLSDKDGCAVELYDSPYLSSIAPDKHTSNVYYCFNPDHAGTFTYSFHVITSSRPVDASVTFTAN